MKNNVSCFLHLVAILIAMLSAGKSSAQDQSTFYKEYQGIGAYPFLSTSNVLQHPDGGYIIGGNQGKFIKTDANGNVLWQSKKHLNMPGATDEQQGVICGVTLSSGSSLFLERITSNDIGTGIHVLTKVSANGTIEFTKRYIPNSSSPNSPIPYSIVRVNDNKFYLLLDNKNQNFLQSAVVCIDSIGNFISGRIFNKTCGGTNGWFSYYTTMTLLPDGNLLLGAASGNGVQFMKMDQDYNVILKKHYNLTTSSSYVHYLEEVEILPNGNMIVSGRSNLGHASYLMLRNNLDLAWFKWFSSGNGGSAWLGSMDEAIAIDNNSIYISGEKDSRGIILHIDSNAVVMNKVLFDPQNINSHHTFPIGMFLNQEGGIDLWAGEGSSSGGGTTWTVSSSMLAFSRITDDLFLPCDTSSLNFSIGNFNSTLESSCNAEDILNPTWNVLDVTWDVLTTSISVSPTTICENLICSLNATGIVPGEMCVGETVQLQNTNEGNPEVIWKLNNTVIGSGTSANFTPELDGSFELTMIVTEGACADSLVTNLLIFSQPEVSAQASDEALCEGESAILTGAGAETYSWNNNIEDGVAFIPNETTTYTVTGVDMNGCINTSSVTLTVNSLPNVSASASNEVLCFGEFTTLTGFGAASYVWTDDVENGVAFNPIETHVYSVTGTDENGCSDSDEIIITVHDLPVVGVSATDEVLCLGESTILNGTGASDYVWDQNIQDGVAFTPSETLVYTVTGTAMNGCANTAEATIVVNELPQVNFSLIQDTLCYNVGEEILLNSGNPSGGTYSGNGVLVVNGDFVFSATFALPGLHTITYSLTDMNGCIGNASDQIEVIVCDWIEQENAQLFEVYPNPVTHMLYGRFVTPVRGNYRLINSTGEIVMQFSSFPLDMSLFEPGIYLLQSPTGETKRIVHL